MLNVSANDSCAVAAIGIVRIDKIKAVLNSLILIIE